MADFLDRHDAGRQLAAELAARLARDETHDGGTPAVADGRNVAGLAPARAGVVDVVVLGLPRGGVPVAEVVARGLGAPLDVIMVRKLGVPVHPELAMGAIGERGIRVLDESIVRHFAVTSEQVAGVQRREQATLERRAALFRAGREPLDLTGKTAVIVDDGMATGATARVACQVARKLEALRVVLAVPVASRHTVDAILAAGEADDVVALSMPWDFRAVGQFYRDFSAVEDETVAAILRGG